MHFNKNISGATEAQTTPAATAAAQPMEVDSDPSFMTEEEQLAWALRVSMRTFYTSILRGTINSKTFCKGVQLFE